MAKPLGFLAAAAAQLTDAERKVVRSWAWYDRAVSLWAPVTVLALVFLVYTFVIEAGPCSAGWLQPAMQYFGALCFWWWAALVVARYVARPWEARRQTRYAAEEVLASIEARLNKNPGRVAEKAQVELREKAAAYWRSLPGDTAMLKAALASVERLGDQHLAKLGGAGEGVSGFVKALAIALLVRTVFIEPFRIPSGSMIPTMEIGDQIFVNKFIYGVRIPFTNTVPFTIVRAPRRGDVVVFNNPVQPDRDFVKRVIGVPGDHLEFKGREVWVNGKPFPHDLRDPEFQTWDQPAPPDGIAPWVRNWFVNDWRPLKQNLSLEHIDGQVHWVQHESWGPMPFDKAVDVPPGQVFVMGDNRDHSADSRFGLGEAELGVQFVPYGHIKGKAMVVWLSLAHGGLFGSLFGGTGFRGDRFAQPISLCGDERQPPVK